MTHRFDIKNFPWKNRSVLWDNLLGKEVGNGKGGIVSSSYDDRDELVDIRDEMNRRVSELVNA